MPLQQMDQQVVVFEPVNSQVYSECQTQSSKRPKKDVTSPPVFVVVVEKKKREMVVEFSRIKLLKINKEGGSSCCNCSKPGHMSCECPQPRNGGGGGRRCYKCQEPSI
uniref:CCHC-type domain-containing protein n=1 Tax=Ditylenchus dipsaci TaxID=166011 RepID=A0A915DF23_9BILA